MTRRIAFINEKGGSCKTTLAVNIGSYLALHREKRVLMVDLDPQGQMGKVLGYNVNAFNRTSLDLLLSNGDPYKFIKKTRLKNLDVVLSNKSLAVYPELVANTEDRNLRLKAVIDRIRGYDYIVIDSPPSFGCLTLNILVAAREVVVPVPLTYLALDGCAEIRQTVEMVRTTFDRPGLKISLVVPTLYRNTRLARAIVGKLHERFPGLVAKTIIGYNVQIDEAQSNGLTIWEYAARSKGARAMGELAAEVAGGYV